ncbi:MAG: penicillin-insensitive murein endopeptidase [Polyangiaceae bacterium]|nr:penicillin-insensitive murein endopeptidase [Polyangiaceae bacterium]
MKYRRAKLPCVVGTALATFGCLATPTPLAPGLGGSVGVPHHGVLTGAVELPSAGPGFVRYRPRGPNHWGIPRLVATVVRAAATVDRELPGGAPLVVGDLSAKHGGKIPGHRSHRTGRDVDLLFFTTTPRGASEKSPGFVRFGPDGLAATPNDRAFTRLDLERNWRLVRTLVTYPNAATQWLFVSRDIEAMLIDYALARGEPLEVIWPAEAMMLQPGDSSPHDDHFHVRLACTAEEAVAGCEGGGPRWDWLAPLPSLEALSLEELLAIERGDPPVLLPLPSVESGA